jgi:hypothetical protein
MAVSSIVVVADNLGIDTVGIDLAFAPGNPYPVEGDVRLYVQGQPFPLRPPTSVVPAITNVHLSYGHFGEGQIPPPLEPDEHWLRELSFGAWYIAGSWRAAGNEATVDIGVSAGLRDNSPPGEQSPPDDRFVASITVQALCIWTEASLTFWERIRGIISGHALISSRGG